MMVSGNCQKHSEWGGGGKGEGGGMQGGREGGKGREVD